MFPDLRLNLIERLRKSGIDLLVLPQSFNNSEDRINLRDTGFRFPVGRKDGIAQTPR
jgi:hypothetical protein